MGTKSSTQGFRVKIPEDLPPSSVLGFTKKLNLLPTVNEYRFDFGIDRWFPPFSMLLLSVALRKFRESHPGARCRAENYRNHGYAAHMGFFKAFGLKHGKGLGEAPGSETYLPMTELSVEEIANEAARGYEAVGDVIERKSERISRLLTQIEEGDLVDTLSFSIREIIRNVVEHSGADRVFYCGQYWPTLHSVGVGIADCGIGMQKALSQNENLAIQSDRDAIHMALLPGISGNPLAGKGATYDHWQNSGYGLYMTNRLCRSGGSFTVCSGQTAVTLDDGHKRDIACDFTGTAIRMEIDTRSIGSLRKKLAQFRDEGAEVARTLSGTTAINPSAASQMLSRDFMNLGRNKGNH